MTCTRRASNSVQDQLLFDRSVAGIPRFNFNNQPLGNGTSAAALANSTNVAGQALGNFGVGHNSNLGYGGLVLSANSESVNVLIRALQETRRLDVLSRPQVQTLNNQEAYILVGSRVPRITNVNQTTVGITNSTQLENVGLALRVVPHISPDGLVVMEIDAEKSELGPASEGIPISINNNGDVIRSPIINTTVAQTTVSARNGQTVILGGLITKTRNTTARQVPYLGDIPILGNLFRFDSVSEQRTELLIIMTPYIVKSPEDTNWINQIESQRMSWCLSDIVDLHGENGLLGDSSVPDQMPHEIIYSDGREPTLDSDEAVPAQELPTAPTPADASDFFRNDLGPAGGVPSASNRQRLPRPEEVEPMGDDLLESQVVSPVNYQTGTKAKRSSTASSSNTRRRLPLER